MRRSLVVTLSAVVGVVAFVAVLAGAQSAGASGLSGQKVSDLGAPPLPTGVDAMIRRGRDATYTGVDTRDQPQQVSFVIPDAGGHVVAYVRIASNVASQRIRVHGTHSNKYFTVRYFVRGVDVTRAIVAGNYYTGRIASGHMSPTIKVVLTRRYETPGGIWRSFHVAGQGRVGEGDYVTARVEGAPGSPIVVP